MCKLRSTKGMPHLLTLVMCKWSRILICILENQIRCMWHSPTFLSQIMTWAHTLK